MKNYEGLGYAIGSVVGAVVTGVLVYFTRHPLCAAASVVCAYVGGSIGREIKRPDKKQ